jgi:hypothetical protein
LAQFSKALVSSLSRGRQGSASGAPESVGLKSVGQKEFAADVVAAMSNPARKANEEVPE